MITRICTALIQGLPVVVILMILYYVIFASAPVTGVFVSVIAFTLTFASAVYSMVRTGVSTIDAGQTEAAYALGVGKNKTFFKIVLPQAMPYILPQYKGELVSLIKATAIVGYIAFEDLIRTESQTLEQHALHLSLELTHAPAFIGTFLLIKGSFQRIVDL